MYLWNNLKISIEGNNHIFIDGIKKYMNAIYDHDYDGECDIHATICNNYEKLTPPVPDDATFIKSLVFNINSETRLDIFSKDNYIWFIYRNTATIWIDYKNNRIIICTEGMPLDFEYYNILLFFLHPIGSLLENFGYFRLHSSSVVINDTAMLITGLSGSGKSTSGFTVPTYGGQIIADDLTFIYKDEEGYHPSSLSALVKLRDDSINKFFPELKRMHSAAHFEDETYFFLADINKTRSEFPLLKGISILSKTGGKASSFKTVHPSEIVPQLFPTTIHTNNEANTGRKFLFITDLLNDLSSYKINFGTDMEEFYSCIKLLINEVADD